MQNPFVYGEIVPGEAFVDREVELDRLVADLAGGQKVFLISPRRYGKSSLIRQALDGAGAPRRADRRGHRQQLQLLRRVPRGLRPGAGGARDADGSGRATWLTERHHVHPARAPLRAEGHRPRPRSRGLSAGAHRARRQPARQRDLRAARPAGRRAQADGRRRARRVPGDRRRSTAAASSTRCAPRRSISARSATSSPAPSRA